MNMKVLAFGEVLWDVIEGSEHLGGAPFNFAAHCGQCGNSAFIISRLGEDDLGSRAFKRSKKYGVDVSLIQWDERYPTGVVDVTLNDGQPEYMIRANAAYDFISAANFDTQLMKNNFDVFYFGSLAQRNFVSRRALYSILSQNRFKHIFYDANLRKSGYSERIIRNSLAVCTIFKLNVDEVKEISQILMGSDLPKKEFCQCVKTIYPSIRIIIITASEDGCFIYESDMQYMPGSPVAVRDAVGSGDAFSASFMHIYDSTEDAVMAARIANRIGAFVASQTGAIPEYSSEIRSLLDVKCREFNE